LEACEANITLECSDEFTAAMETEIEGCIDTTAAYRYEIRNPLKYLSVSMDLDWGWGCFY